MLVLRRAIEEDAALLTDLSRRAFEEDILYGAPGPGGPPGYDDVGWQRWAIRAMDYYLILFNGNPIGGLIAYPVAERVYELGRIFIAPEWQNQGLGAQALACLWLLYPQVETWRLDTPAWNRRTRHFYARQGFVETGINEKGLVLFERRKAPKDNLP